VDYLEGKDLLIKGSRTDFAGNVLVLIAPAEKPFTFTPAPGADLAAAFSGRLAVGDPQAVPAGKYAKEALEWMKCWDGLKSRLAPSADVRSTLRLVATGETDAGIVYRTDAAVEPRVAIVAAFPEQSHTPVVYTAALCKGAKEHAHEFISLIKSAGGKALLEKRGFTLPGNKE
jgi:molybdate transport system substrate-binding protein